MNFVGFRCARPTSDLEALKRFYVDGLGCSPIGRFDGHDGFDGLIVGAPDGDWQVEFVVEHGRRAPPPPSPEHLLVFYVASRDALAVRAAAVDAAGFHRVSTNNPYWARHGVTYADPDGYPVVIAVPHGS